MNLRRLSWDSDFFGFEVARVDLEPGEAFDAQQLDAFNLVYLFSNNALPEAEAQLPGLFLADEKITYHQTVDEANGDRHLHIRSFREPVTPAIISLSIQSGAYSRFKVDSRIPSGKFEDLYRLWIEKSASRDIADDLLVFNDSGIPQGLITLKDKGGFIDIGILAVDEKSRGKKIGTHLINAAKHYCLQNRFINLEVVTQLANKPACEFYEKQGFKPKSIQYVYHYWR